MAKFLYEVDEKTFLDLREKRLEDDKKVSNYLENLITLEDDRRFNFTILNLGEIMKIGAITLSLKSEEIEKYLKLEKEQIRTRRMNNIIKELNHKINLRFNFNEDIEIVPCLYTYEGNGYIFIDKMFFCDLLNQIDISIETLENI